MSWTNKPCVDIIFSQNAWNERLALLCPCVDDLGLLPQRRQRLKLRHFGCIRGGIGDRKKADAAHGSKVSEGELHDP